MKRRKVATMLGDQPSFGVGTKLQAECADKEVRTATVLGHADTFWTVPARVVVRGKTVTGFVYWRNSVLRFSPNAWGRNALALPEWSPESN